MMNYKLLCMISVLTVCLLPAVNRAVAADYNPLKLPDDVKISAADFTVTDASRQREIPVRIYLPQQETPAPVVLFSHGLGGSREGNIYLNNHWAARGYIVVCLQHPGSDTSVWQDKPREERLQAMKNAAGIENFMLRVKDVAAVISQLENWNKTSGHILVGKMDMNKIAMSGHSFGAVTTQAVSGQNFILGKISFTDARIKAAIIFSPSCPRKGDPQQTFGSVAIPWMLMTGTDDVAIIGDADMKSRLAVFPALPPGGKYELVLNKAQHSAFSDRELPGDTGKRNPNHHRAIQALSTAFLDAWLMKNPEAKAWLDGESPRAVLEPADKWQKK
jgi:predicted dienelactone hydrolase